MATTSFVSWGNTNYPVTGSFSKPILEAAISGISFAARYLSGYSSLYLISAALLGKSVKDFQSQPTLNLPLDTQAVTAQNFSICLNKLYDDLQICGLKSENKQIAIRRFSQLIAAIAPNSISPSAADLTLLQNLYHVLRRNNSEPSLETIAFDVGSLYCEMATAAPANRTQCMKKFNLLLSFIQKHPNDPLCASQIPKLLTIQAVLQRQTSTVVTPATAPFDIKCFFFKLRKEGLKDPILAAQKVAEFERQNVTDEDALKDLNAIKSFLTAQNALTRIAPAASTALAPATARNFESEIGSLALEILQAEGQGTLAQSRAALLLRYNALEADLALISPSERRALAELVEILQLTGAILQTADPAQTTAVASTAITAATSMPSATTTPATTVAPASTQLLPSLPTPMKVVTYNILAQCTLHHFGARVANEPTVFDWQTRTNLLVQEIQGLDADILLLQEVDTATFQKISAALGANYQGFVRYNADGRFGCALFVRNFETARRPRFEVIAESVLPYGGNGGIVAGGDTTGRIAQIARIRIPALGKVIGVANTHLDFNRNTQQIQALTQGISIGNPANEWIIGGDFNSGHGGPVVGALLTADYAYDNSIQATVNTNASLKTYDHIFHTRGLQSRAFAPYALRATTPMPNRHKGSDHVAVYAEMQFV